MSWTEADKKNVWNKASTVDGKDKDEIRADACGALIKWDEYGEETNIGWDIDHIYPESKAKEKGFEPKIYNATINIRALHYINNRTGGKGDDYPNYTSQVTSDGNKNVEQEKRKVVNKEKQKGLEKHFGQKLT